MSIALSVLLSACGQGYKTHKIVENFLEQQMKVAEYNVIEWGKRFISYQEATNKLNYITVKYVKGTTAQDTVSQTFYLNDELTGVVAFKNNQ